MHYNNHCHNEVHTTVSDTMACLATSQDKIALADKIAQDTYQLIWLTMWRLWALSADNCILRT